VLRTKRTVYLLLFLLAFFVLLISGFPLSAALKMAGLEQQNVSWRNASGTIWRGEIEGLVYDIYPVGTVQHRLRLLPLLTGRADADIVVSGGALRGQGRVQVGAGAIQLSNSRFDVNVGAYGLKDPTDSLIRGNLLVTAERLHFTRKGCIEAAGEIESDALVYSAKIYGAEGFVLKGPAACDGDKLRVVMEGRSARDAAVVNTVLQPNLDYTAEITVNSTNIELGAALSLYGFQKRDGDHIMVYRSNLMARS
jgi:general secretion pathway protein N